MPVYEYCTVNDLRREGVSIDEENRDHVAEIIQIVSARINQFTGQIFQPIVEDQYVDGKDSPITYLPNFVPIQVLTGIDIMEERTGRGLPTVLPHRREYSVSLSDVQLDADRRLIEWVAGSSSSLGSHIRAHRDYDINNEIRFPRGRQNIKLSGIFGWLENASYVESAVTQDADKGDSDIHVDSTDGWEVNDWALFQIGDVKKLQRVCKVCDTDSTLVFSSGDSKNIRFEVPTGTVVQSIGQTPLLIKRAAVRLTVRDLPLLSSEDGQRDDIMAQAIVQEKTDNYSYKMDPYLIMQRLESGSTGDSQVDSILQKYIDDTPVYVGMV